MILISQKKIKNREKAKNQREENKIDTSNNNHIQPISLYSKYGLNNCDSHVDFMVGNKDLNITGITCDNKEIPIFINGNFTEEFN